MEYQLDDKQHWTTFSAEHLDGNKTTVEPDLTGLKPYFDVTTQTWIAEPTKPVTPTEQQAFNATVLAEIAKNKSDQDRFNSQALLQLATLAAKPIVAPTSTFTTNTSKEVQA